jgi:hypothetical protein
MTKQTGQLTGIPALARNAAVRSKHNKINNFYTTGFIIASYALTGEWNKKVNLFLSILQ